MLLGLLLGGASFLLSGFGLIGLVLYFVPTVVAFVRKVPNSMSVFVVNLFLGWSLIGWVVALALAVRTKPSS
ncbi:MAG: superinfection immunity protein [Actinomycetota bacterium]|nr:superinfection immunity protein [Actinomycetota bacterium]